MTRSGSGPSSGNGVPISSGVGPTVAVRSPSHALSGGADPAASDDRSPRSAGPPRCTASSGSMTGVDAAGQQRNTRCHRDRFTSASAIGPVLVMVGDGTDPADRPALGGEHGVPGHGQRVHRAVQVAATPVGAAAGRGCAPGPRSPGRGSSPCPGARRWSASRPRSGWCVRRCPPRGAVDGRRSAARVTAQLPTGRAPAAISRPATSPRSSRGTAISMPVAVDRTKPPAIATAEPGSGIGRPAARARVAPPSGRSARAEPARRAPAGRRTRTASTPGSSAGRRRDPVRCPGS